MKSTQAIRTTLCYSQWVFIFYFVGWVGVNTIAYKSLLIGVEVLLGGKKETTKQRK